MDVTHSMMRLEDDVACSNATTCRSIRNSVWQSMVSSFSIYQRCPTFLNGTNIKHQHDDTFAVFSFYKLLMAVSRT